MCFIIMKLRSQIIFTLTIAQTPGRILVQLNPVGQVSAMFKYKLKRCSNKECCKQCRHVVFKGTMTKWPVQKLAQGTTQKLLQHHDATDIQKTYIFVFFIPINMCSMCNRIHVSHRYLRCISFVQWMLQKYVS